MKDRITRRDVLVALAGASVPSSFAAQHARDAAVTAQGLLAGTTRYPVGAALRTRDGHSYQVVSSGGLVTTEGGVELKIIPGPLGYDVRAFGASADGTTDDRAIIQAAIVALGAIGGGTLFGCGFKYAIDSGAGLKNDHDHIFFRDFNFVRSNAGNTGFTLTFAANNDIEGGGVINCRFNGIPTLAANGGLQMGTSVHYANRWIVDNVIFAHHGQYGIGIGNGHEWDCRNLRIVEHGLTTGAISSCMGFYLFPRLASRGGKLSNIYSRISEACQINRSANTAAVKIQTHQNLQASGITAIGGREEALSIDSPSGVISKVLVHAQAGRPAMIVSNQSAVHTFSGQSFVLDDVQWFGGTSYIGGGTDGNYTLAGCTLRNFKSPDDFDVLDWTAFKDCVFEDWNLAEISLSTADSGKKINRVVNARNVFTRLSVRGGDYPGQLAIMSDGGVIKDCGCAPLTAGTTNGFVLRGDGNDVTIVSVRGAVANGIIVRGSENRILNAQLHSVSGRSIWFPEGSNNNTIYTMSLGEGTGVLNQGSGNVYPS